MQHRLPALDWMRGLVMVLMVTDHASSAFNANHPVTDSTLWPGWDQPLDPLEFFVRWLSHLCAPVFVFLAGTSLALSMERKRALGASEWSLDRDLLIRGLLILAVEFTFIYGLWFPAGFLLQVLFAIGSSMLLMIGLRRLPSSVLVILALGLFLLGEWTRTGVMGMESTPFNLARGLLIDGGYFTFEFTSEHVMAAYPTLPWCAMMMLGWVLGRWLLGRKEQPEVAGRLWVLGLGALAIFAVVRGADYSFGNLGLTRTDSSWLQWLHVSKYPPSITFAALELGIMLLLLAAFFRFDSVRKGPVNSLNPLLVFGQTAFFFYVAHILLIEVVARQTEIYHAGGLVDALLGSAIALAVLYPVCLIYRRIKATHPRSLLRYF